jgi:hypothetical protein
MWRQRLKAIGEFGPTQSVLLLVTAVLVCIGYVLAASGPDHLTKLIVFAAVCLATYHVTFWLLQKKTSDRSLKAVDYLYLAMGFIGVFGALDLQATIYKPRVSHIMDFHLPIVEETNTGCDEKKDDSPECYFRNLTVFLLKTRPYDHLWLRDRLKMIKGRGGSIEVPARFAYELADLYDEMELQVFQYVEPSEKAAFNRKMFAYYILCLALILRITKVSAELMQWHRPKPASAPPDCQNQSLMRNNTV